MKTNHNNILYVFVLSILLFSCKGDDDGGTSGVTGFFPKTIQITSPTSSDSDRITFEYNSKNQIITINDGETEGITYQYNDNDMISSMNSVDEQLTIEYNGAIISRIIDNETNQEFEVTYTDGTYEFISGTLTFDTDNRLVNSGMNLSILYSENSGTFDHLDFQPFLFFTFPTHFVYFFAPDEVSTIIQGTIEYTFHTTRDTNGNIAEVQVRDAEDNQVFTYLITYEERIITNE